MNVEIDGTSIQSEAEFHAVIVNALNFPSYYGKNLDALLDILSSNVERPLVLIWKNSACSKASMADAFAKIVDALRRIEDQDIEWGLAEKFKLQLD